MVGTSDELASTLELAARLRAIHMIDHDGEVLGLGSPNEDADDISRRLAMMRGCMSQLKSSPGSNLIRLDRVRESLSGSLSESMLSVSEDLTRLEDSSSELEQLAEQVELLERLDPLGLGLDLLQGYDSVSVNLGHVPLLAQCLGAIHGLSEDTYVFDAPGKGKEGTLAVFCESSSAGVVEKLLSEHAFQSIAVPEGDGLISDRISSLKTRASELRAEQDGLRAALKTWNDENGAMLVGGIEVLESDFEIETAPVRVATSEHAFIIEGWVLTEESEATVAALAEVATYVECTPFEMPRGRGHHFSEEEIELPPIAFQNIGPATPYELLTDAVGRPKYGRMDPTTFMFFTYPIFFGLMLGDIAYGLAIVGLAWWLSRKFSRNELVVQGSLLLFYIGVSTIVFGYLFGEFAGFEYLPHGHCDIEGIVGVAQCEAAHGHYHWE
ncbi:MAG TPA: V-type ATPase 116kDa subunit family protein, partial [Candidatus Poseidoniales archaeon]|nr:V-type ATPase 116kDa subunit family protein [Candidatus Poseidoniales archaeon]